MPAPPRASVDVLGDWHGLLIGADHRVYVWGGRSYGALGDGIMSGRSQSPDFLAD